jgi:hypothetical protein
MCRINDLKSAGRDYGAVGGKSSINSVVYLNVPTMKDEEIKRRFDEITKQLHALKKTDHSVEADTQQKTEKASTRSKLLEALKVVGSALAVCLAVYLAFTNMVSHELSKQLGPMKDDLTGKIGMVREDVVSLKSDSTGLRRDVDRIMDAQAKQVLGAKTTVSAEDITLAAKRALAHQIPIPPKEIEAISTSLLQGAATPVSWEATTALLNLRSFVNSRLEEAKHMSCKRSGQRSMGSGSSLQAPENGFRSRASM